MKKIVFLFFLSILFFSAAIFFSLKPPTAIITHQDEHIGLRSSPTKQSIIHSTTITNVPTLQISVTLQPRAISHTLYAVIDVVDGDTIDVLIDGKKQRMRLIGINSPETVDPHKEIQCYGPEASNFAKHLLTGKEVSLIADPSQQNTDKYGRLLRYIYLADGTFVNQLMIEDGYAYEYTYRNIPYKYQTAFKETELQARKLQVGLWSKNTCNGKL